MVILCFVEKDYQANFDHLFRWKFAPVQMEVCAPVHMEWLLEELPGLPAHLHPHVHLLLGGDVCLLCLGVHLDRDVLGVQASLDLLVH